MTEPYYERYGVTVHHGDCLDVLAELPDASVHAVVTDPPYSLAFMGREWDRHDTPAGFQAWCKEWTTQCARVLKPGGHLLAFGGSRTWHRLTCAVEDAGFEIRDNIVWLYASGFPKSLDVSKAIDKAAGVEREFVGFGPDHAKRTAASGRGGTVGRQGGDAPIGQVLTAPATDAARAWQGWGTALKPGFEPIVVARKPLAGTVAVNVLEHGVGALNVDGCRTPADSANARANKGLGLGYYGGEAQRGAWSGSAGRWPSNVVLTHAATPDGVDLCVDECVPGCPVRELDEQSGQSSGVRPSGDVRSSVTIGGAEVYAGGGAAVKRRHQDSGGASRFFPVFRFEAKAPSAERPRVDGVAHPTVKPLALMRWVVRLVTPPGGTVLDPFLGSGTTAQAARAEEFRCVGIEREESYLPLIRARLDGEGVDLFGGDAA